MIAAKPRPVKIANPRACAQCPWRLSNQGRRHPDGWYTKANLRRLWSKLRRGERMTCHPTDPTNPVPPGGKHVAEEVTTHECTGATILQEREVVRFQTIAKEDPGRTDALREYKRRHPHGMSRVGLIEIAMSAVFGKTPFVRDIARPNLLDPDVGYEPLGPFTRP